MTTNLDYAKLITMGGLEMKETWIGYDGLPYKSEKEKIKADLKYIANLQKSGKHPFYGMDGQIYLDEKDLLIANRNFLNDEPKSTLRR